MMSKIKVEVSVISQAKGRVPVKHLSMVPEMIITMKS